MSKVFLTEKDNIIDSLDDDYKLELSEEEYARLRECTNAQLLLLAVLFARAAKNKDEGK